MQQPRTVAHFIFCLLAVAGAVELGLRKFPPVNEPAQAATGKTAPAEIPSTTNTATAAAAEPMDFNTVRSGLARLDKTNAVAEIIRLLNRGKDARTGLGFKLNRDGSLKAAPTLRVYLLDQLRRLDPAAAAAYARTILDSKTSPDEWAVALQSLAAGDATPGARDLLKQKFTELLAYAPWQQNPSTGYLEAFDVAVFLGDSSLANPLAGLLANQSDPAVAHAAYLALDRMIIANPAAVLTALGSDPGLMAGRENTRADYFARADVQNAQQRQVLESYLLNPQISPAELGQFAGIFPNANYMISPNLLTGNPTPDHAALVARDQASLQAVGEWLADPRFARLQAQLLSTQQRLQGFVRQEQGAP